MGEHSDWAAQLTKCATCSGICQACEHVSRWSFTPQSLRSNRARLWKPPTAVCSDAAPKFGKGQAIVFGTPQGLRARADALVTKVRA